MRVQIPQQRQGRAVIGEYVLALTSVIFYRCDKMTKTRQLEGRRVTLGSQFEVRVHHSGEGMVAESQSHKPTVRK